MLDKLKAVKYYVLAAVICFVAGYLLRSEPEVKIETRVDLEAQKAFEEKLKAEYKKLSEQLAKYYSSKKTYYPDGTLQSEEQASVEESKTDSEMQLVESQQKLDEFVKASLQQTVTIEKDDNILTIWGSITVGSVMQQKFQEYGFLYQRRVVGSVFGGAGAAKTEVETKGLVATSFTF